MAITKVINDAVDLNQTSDYSGLRLPVGTTGNVVESFTTDYLVVAGGGGTGTDSPGGGGAGGLRTSYNNSTTTTNSLNFPAGKTAIATYMLDGNATDISENYNGVETSITYNTGKYGGGAVFNGSSSYINTNYTLTSSTTFTWSGWIKTSNTKNTYVTGDFNAAGANAQHRFSIRIYSQNFMASVNDAGGGTGTAITFGTFAHYGGWAHLVVTVDGTAVTGYVNGSQLGSTGTSSQSLAAGANPLTLGMYGSGGTGVTPFDGLIDQVRIYDTALSSTDVYNIYINEVQANSGGGSAAESSLTLSEGVAYDVTVGAGGFKTFGSNSVFSNITSTGGGSGGGSGSSSGYNGGNGGSGGGASGGNYSLPGGNGTTAQGYAGGGSGSQAGSGYPGGGGGGASAKGQTLATSSDNGGTGGDGVITNILNSTNAASSYIGEVSGSNVYYSGGGGGSTYTTTLGAGGLGGGADGQRYLTAQVTNNGTTNTGGGGGAQNSTGGSGVVILRYPTASVSSFTTTGTLNTPSTTDTIADTAYPVANTAYYKLDNSAIDLSGSTGKFDQAGVFNGSSSAIILPNNILSSDFSISAWFYLNNTSGNQYLFEFDYENRVLFRVSSTDNNWAYIGNSGYFNPGITYNAGQWYNVVITFSNGNPFKIYVNGVLSYTGGNTSVSAFSNDNILGAANSSGSGAVNGLIDQVRIYNTELSSDDVIALYGETISTTGQLNFPSGQTAIATYELNGNANGILTTTDLSTVNYPAGAGCIALYEMNGAADDTSGVYNGTPSNIDYNFGAFGQAAVFNGSSSYIQTSLTKPAGTAFSFSCWINTPGGVQQHIVGDYNSSIANPTFRIQIPTNNTLSVGVGTGTGAVDYVSFPTIPGLANTWKNLIITVDGTSVNAYINGVALGTTQTSAQTLGAGAQPYTLGAYRPATGYQNFSGSIDQVRFFNTALTQAQVTTLARGIGTSYSGADTNVLYAYNGTPTNVTYGNGRFNEAANFNGSSAYIDLPLTSLFGGKNTLAISFWFKTITTGRQRMFSDYAQTSRNCDIVIDAGNIEVTTDYNQSTNLQYTSSSTYNDGDWHNLIVSLDQSAGQRTIYIDGSLVNTGTLSTNSWSGSGQKVTLGVLYSSSSGYLQYFDGEIDQLRVFNTALSNFNATDLYNEHYQTQFTEGSDTAIVFTEGTGTVTFNGVDPAPPQGALRTNTSYSEDGSASVIEHYNGTAWKYFDAIKYCTTNTLNFPSGAGCIASYNLNNNVDDIGNTYNGINSNVTFTASGKFGAAAVFDGTVSNEIDLNYNTNYNNFSISAWINPSAITSQHPIVGKWWDGTNRSFQFWLTSSGVGVDIAYTDSNTDHVFYNTNVGALSTNTWYFVCVTWENGVGLTLTVDADTQTHSIAKNIRTNTSNWFIGQQDSRGVRAFTGFIDQVRIFNDSLTSDEVTQLYNNEIACS